MTRAPKGDLLCVVIAEKQKDRVARSYPFIDDERKHNNTSQYNGIKESLFIIQVFTAFFGSGNINGVLNSNCAVHNHLPPLGLFYNTV